MNPYVILGVPIDAEDQVIRSAFRSLVRRYHPDSGEGASPEKFRLLVEAYETLTDPTRRQEYDQSLRPKPQPKRIAVEPLIGPTEPLLGRRRPPLAMHSPVSVMWASGFD